jgi:flagellar biosynthesis protein FlhF
MEIRSFRTQSLREAWQLVGREVGLPAGRTETDESATCLPAAPPDHQRFHLSPGSEQPCDTWIPPAEHQSFRDQIVRSVRDEATDCHSLVEQLCRREDDPNSLPESFFHVFARLMDLGFDEPVARELLLELRQTMSSSSVPDEQQIWSKLILQVKLGIRIAGPIKIPANEQRVVALVGPTGVGKTTTVAKLAAEFRLRQRRRVGLVTLDTYRIAAVDQLQAYANIMDLPLEVVADPRATRDAVARLSDQDLILIDTPGRNPLDELPLSQLQAALRSVEPHEIQLVVSATSAAKSMIQIVNRFQRVGITAMILTKLDESSSPQELAPVFRSCRCPISYLTDGQNVPDNIEPADRDRLSRWLFRIPPPDSMVACPSTNERESGAA